MFPYIFLSTLSGLNSILYRRKSDNLISAFIFIALLFLVTFRGGGFGLGDYDNYRRFYNLVLTWSDVINISVPAEIGFRFFSYIGNTLGFNSQFIIVVMGLLSIIPVFWLIKKKSDYKVLALFFWLPYFLTFNMHTSRTAVAAGFGVLFIFFFYKGKYLLSSLLFFVAFSFHKSAFILLLVFLTLCPLEILFYFAFFLFFTLILVTPLDISILLLNKFGMSSLSSKIIAYRGGYFGYPMPLYDPRILISLLISFFGYKIRYKLTNFEIYYLKVFVIGTLLLISFSEVVIMAWRSSYFFLLNGVIVIPFLAKYYNLMIFKGSNIKMLASLFVVFSYGLYLAWLIYGGEPFILYQG